MIIIIGDLNKWLSLIYNLNLIIKYKHKQQGIGESKQFIKNKSMNKRRGSVDIALLLDFLLLSVKWQICGKSHIYIELRCWYETVMHSGAYSPSISAWWKVTRSAETHIMDLIWIWIARAFAVRVVLCAIYPVCNLNFVQSRFNL